MVVSSAEKRSPPATASTPATKQVVTQVVQAGGRTSEAAGTSLTGVSIRELAGARAEGMYCAFNFFISFAFQFAP